MNQFLWPSSFSSNLGTLSFREFLTTDASEIAAIDRTLNPSPWSEKQFLESINCAHLCMGAKSNNEWLAYCVLSFVAGEAELLILGVAQKAQRNGVAKKMLEAMFPVIASKVSTVFLEVRESNYAALALYEDLGFNQVGERQNYYPVLGASKKETALIFAKELIDY